MVQKNISTCVVLSLACIAAAQSAHATGLTLTSTGIADGFSLSTFVDGFQTGSNIGPLGVTFLSNGNVMVDDFVNGGIRIFTDTDGQHAGDVSPSQTYGGNGPIGLTTLNGSVYVADRPTTVYKLNNDGSIASTITTSIAGPTGIANDGTNLFVDGNGGASGGLYMVNPTTHAVTTIANGSFDGLTVDAVAGILYAESNNHIYGYRISDFALISDTGALAGNEGLDGVAIGRGTLAGNLYINTNSGTFYQFNIATSALTLLANGGSRGDFVAVDSNGSLLITQSDRIMRLTPSAGGTFADTPEPGTFAVALGTLGALFLIRRRA